MRYATIIILLLASAHVSAQTRSVSGILFDADGKIPVPGVTVAAPGTANSTVTDVNGEFSLVIDSEPAIIMLLGFYQPVYFEYKEGETFRKIVLDGGRKAMRESRKARKKWRRAQRQQR